MRRIVCQHYLSFIFFKSSSSMMLLCWGTGIRVLMRGMATLPQGNQELLVVKDKLKDPQVSLG